MKQPSVTTGEVRAALARRLAAVGEKLDVPVAGLSVTAHLAALIKRCRASKDPAEMWLLFVGVAAAFPTPLQMEHFARRIAVATDGGAFVGALAATIDAASRRDGHEREIEIVDDGTIVDVNFCATQEHNTGIQRVVRETLPRWVERGRDIQLVAWTEQSPAMRTLSEVEVDRVLSWNDRRVSHGTAVEHSSDSDTIIVPWRSTVFMPEVPFAHLCAPIAAMAQWAGNRVVMLGYDAIPLVSADTLPAAEAERFAHYLTAVKYSTRIVAISESAASEFAGFVRALPTQGLSGPEVTAVPLAVAVPVEPAPAHYSTPMILCVGSHEPRKNQEAVILAGEILHREGHEFRLVFVGGGSRLATRKFDQRVARLRRSRFDVRSYRRVSDADLWKLYSEARFTAFISLHEGFGLPVAESLALGVPALTSNYGSLAEIAADGGCLMIDPRDDEAVIEGMRRMLIDDDLVAQLRTEARSRSPRTWAAYSDELWAAVCEVGT